MNICFAQMSANMCYALHRDMKLFSERMDKCVYTAKDFLGGLSRTFR